MKYGKLLQLLLEQMPAEYRDKFLSYKQLKKVINTILQHNSLPAAAFVEVEDRKRVTAVVGAKRKAAQVEEARQVAARGEEKELTNEEETFLQLLNKELEKFNSFFTEKEEEYVIRLQELKNMLETVRQEGDASVHPSDRGDDLMTIRIDLVTLHGELILMETYSTLNYTGLVKILKKHDKRTGAVLRLPFIRRVLLQPFFSTELLSQLVKQCNDLLSTFPPTPRDTVQGAGDSDSASERPYATGPVAEGIFKGTVAALRTIQEMRKGSSTVSPLSLPPCDLKEESWSSKFSDSLRKPEPEGMSCAS